jgi:hypothetical protein
LSQNQRGLTTQSKDIRKLLITLNALKTIGLGDNWDWIAGLVSENR